MSGVFALTTAPAPAPARLGVWVEREAFLMGTSLQAAVLAPDRARGLAALEAAFAAVARAESLLSTWRDDSEIARLNRAAPGHPVPLSPELFASLAEAWRWCRESGGAFDPAVGALVDAWDLRGRGRRPSPDRLGRARGDAGCGTFAFDSAARTGTRLSAGSWIDTGGFGKGVALRSARQALERRGIVSGILDFGGQVLVFGRAPEGGRWRVPVAHPSRRQEQAAALRIPGGSAATSAQSERYVEAAGERLGHILDPRTGAPVAAWGSVTVVAADPADADALSTTLFVLGPDAGLRWAERRGIAALFLVERAGAIETRATRAMRSHVVHDATHSSVKGG